MNATLSLSVVVIGSFRGSASSAVSSSLLLSPSCQVEVPMSRHTILFLIAINGTDKPENIQYTSEITTSSTT